MGRQAIFLSDEKPEDVEGYPDYSKNDDKLRPSAKYFSVGSETEASASPIRVFVKWALICTLIVLAMTFTLELFEPQSSKSPAFQHSYYGEIPKTCPGTKHRKTLSFDFNKPTELAFAQESHDPKRHGPDFGFVRTVGKVEVLKQDSLSNVRIALDIRSSDPQLTSSESLSVVKSGSALTVKTPRRTPRESSSAGGAELPCIYVAATVSIPPGTTLENLGIKTETLSVTFFPGLDYAITNRTEINAHSASLSLATDEPPSIVINSRETRIHLNSGSVTGSYPLYDTLDISTTSGSIDIDVEPKDAEEGNVQPAVLRLSSQSGSIRALTSTVSVPARDYQMTVKSLSGSIDATLLHGSRTSLRSNNGRINADLYPYGHNDSRTDINTHSQSGSTDITVHSSLSHPIDPIRKLYSEHHGLSGSLNLWYPAQWQGTVKGSTLSGGIDLDWDGLKVVKDEKRGWVKRTIEAVRGEGESQLIFSGRSGRVNLGGDSGGGVFAGRKV
ncbi:hypothetical protein HO173_004843 [Letharia columbiana]|uniref:Adhesin domain-containing protein n=1 Tax=Letharia columbiana TaxID=112416 RepID=A0A8H6L612_9LECA|nr:uncharacterized protein HO173_004843 [Letharia columbiana]KAF6236964.1 hypothetical protein HO173_004843 [Letharia columbiana]